MPLTSEQLGKLLQAHDRLHDLILAQDLSPPLSSSTNTLLASASQNNEPNINTLPDSLTRSPTAQSKSNKLGS